MLKTLLIGAVALVAITPANAARYPDELPLTLSVAHADLVLAEPSAQQELAGRVHAAVQAFCRDHAAQVVPHHLRANKGHCFRSVRAIVVQQLAPDVRRAYAAGRRAARRSSPPPSSPGSVHSCAPR